MPEEITNKFKEWTETELGKKIIAAEEKCLLKAFSHCFGYFFLQVGYCPYQLLYKKLFLTYQLYVGHGQDACHKNYIVADNLQLPFQSNSIDAVLLPHTIEMFTQQHELLREVSRVLLPGGHLLMACFNPYSYVAIKKYLHCKSMRTPWLLKMLTQKKARDWLELLDFEIISFYDVYPSFPLGKYLNDKWIAFILKYKSNPLFSLGACYIIVAKKRVNEPIMMKKSWQFSRKKADSANVIEV